MAIVLTGAAGFIGMHVAQLLLQRGDTVIGIDNVNDYYDPALKRARLSVYTVILSFAFMSSIYRTQSHWAMFLIKTR